MKPLSSSYSSASPVNQWTARATILDLITSPNSKSRSIFSSRVWPSSSSSSSSSSPSSGIWGGVKNLKKLGWGIVFFTMRVFLLAERGHERKRKRSEPPGKRTTEKNKQNKVPLFFCFLVSTLTVTSFPCFQSMVHLQAVRVSRGEERGGREERR